MRPWIALFSFAYGTAALAAPVNTTSFLQIHADRLREAVSRLNTLEIDIAGVDHEASTVGVIVTPDQHRLLRDVGFDIIPSLNALSDVGPDAEYHTPEKVAADLQAFQVRYPELIQVSSFGRSVQGRDILVARISNDRVPSNKAKPAILINAMHHAREVMTTEVALDAIDQILSRYGHDARVTRWVDSGQIYIVPMLNVDGNHKVWTDSPMWRKNVHENYGVDINRNYPFRWSECNGSSGSRFSETYRGPSPASEPETLALMNLVSRIHPVLDLSLHSYSELVIYPYGCENETTTTPAILAEIGNAMATALPRDSGSGHYTAGTAPDILYGVDGDDLSWMLHEFQVLPYVIEVNASSQGFQPSFAQWRQPTVEKLRAAWGILLDRLTGPAIAGSVETQDGRAIANAIVSISGTERSGTTVQVQLRTGQEGAFHAILNPGDYVVSAVNAQTAAQPVSVQVENEAATVTLVLN